MITLVIGWKEEKVVCHKVLLGFYSEFFDAALYGNFSSPQEIKLPDESLETVTIFVSWMYTGQVLPGPVLNESLWILGDRLRSQYFVNDIMHLLLAKYTDVEGRYYGLLEAAAADLAYRNTTSGSKLRKFIKDIILTNPPLSFTPEEIPTFGQDWKALITRGGDLVVDVALHGSFCYKNPDDVLWVVENQEEYLEPIKTRPLVEFMEGKCRNNYWE